MQTLVCVCEKKREGIQGKCAVCQIAEGDKGWKFCTALIEDGQGGIVPAQPKAREQ